MLVCWRGFDVCAIDGGGMIVVNGLTFTVRLLCLFCLVCALCSGLSLVLVVW